MIIKSFFVNVLISRMNVNSHNLISFAMNEIYFNCISNHATKQSKYHINKKDKLD